MSLRILLVTVVICLGLVSLVGRAIDNFLNMPIVYFNPITNECLYADDPYVDCNNLPTKYHHMYADPDNYLNTPTIPAGTAHEF